MYPYVSTNKLTKVPSKKFIKIGERYVPAPLEKIPEEACIIYCVISEKGDMLSNTASHRVIEVQLGYKIIGKRRKITFTDKQRLSTAISYHWDYLIQGREHADEPSALAHAAALNAMYNTFYYKHED